jgi:hypothetical protein
MYIYTQETGSEESLDNSRGLGGGPAVQHELLLYSTNTKMARRPSFSDCTHDYLHEATLNPRRRTDPLHVRLYSYV